MPKTECCCMFWQNLMHIIQQKVFFLFFGRKFKFWTGENELILKSTNLDGKLGCIQQWNTNCYVGGGRRA